MNNQQQTSGTILWLTGWSISDSVFDQLRELLPDFDHISVGYNAVDSPYKMLQLTEMAAKSSASALRGPLLIAGWSLGGLLALNLATKGYVDGLVLFAATARFTRSKEETERGWADGFVRQMMTALSKDPQCVEEKFRRNMFTEAEWQDHLGKNLPPIGSWTTPALIAGLQVLRNEDYLFQLPFIQCPVLIIHGTEDRICPYGAALELAELLHKAELLPIPDCGHALFLGREADIAINLRRWWHEQ